MRPFCPDTGGGLHATEILLGEGASHRIVSGGEDGAEKETKIKYQSENFGKVRSLSSKVVAIAGGESGPAPLLLNA